VLIECVLLGPSPLSGGGVEPLGLSLANRGISPIRNRAGLRACRFFTGRAGGPCYQVSRDDAGTVRAPIGGDDYQLSRSLPSDRGRRLIELSRRGLHHGWRRFEGLLRSRAGADAYGGRPGDHRAMRPERQPVHRLIALPTRPREVAAAMAGHHRVNLADAVFSCSTRSPRPVGSSDVLHDDIAGG
jgi:hypothetical protein